MAEQQPVVILPAPVENLIVKICKEHSLPPLDFNGRQQLATIQEEQAIEILNTISQSKTIRSLGGYINYLLKYSSSSPSKLSPSKSSSPVPATATATVEEVVPMADSGVLSALGELEFRKAFLLLSYAGSLRENIDSFISADYIRRLKDSPMRDFESKIWRDIGHNHLEYKERQLYLDWDSGRTHIYQCHVSPDGSLKFKGPILQHTRTLLQKSLGDDNVLVVNFAEDENVRNTKNSAQEAAELYGKFRKEGIRVGLRLYRFFVFKDGGKEEKKKDSTTSSVKCYFVRTESQFSADKRALYILSNYKTITEARSLFMHAHMLLPSVNKYMARFSLILSKTLTLKIDFANVNVQTIEDVSCRDENGKVVVHNGKPRILTDGTGFISEDLARLCPNDVFKGSNLKNGYMEISNLVEPEDLGVTAPSTNQPPLLIQCRLFHEGRAIKGTLLVNKTLPPRTIQVRRLSMIKVKTDSDSDSRLSDRQSINSMEVVTTSNKPKRGYLSKYLIALLSYGGVPNDFFMDVLKSNLEDTNYVYSNKRKALTACVNSGEMDEYNAAEMILCGIPLDEPYLRYRLSIVAKLEKDRLKGGRVHLPDCFYLMGTVDPTGCLKMNEVCIIHEKGQISGDVLVYRSPGLHFGDVHILRATPVDGLDSYVGHSKYAIFFPCVGPRSIADEIAGGDFDGDMYWVSNNPQLLEYFRKSDPWIERTTPILDDSIVKKPSELSDEELEDHLFNLFLKTRFESSYAMGVAADSWMALMDRYLILRNDPNKANEMSHVRENILKLIDIYYEALDAPKKGGGKIQVPNDLTAEIFPHYMDNKFKLFTSSSILGKIYDEVSEWQTKDDMSGKEIGKLSCFDKEVPRSCLEKWEKLYEDYKKDMTNVLRPSKTNDVSLPKKKTTTTTNVVAAEVINIYKQKLYGAANMEESTKNICDIFDEALAIYNVAYDCAIKEKSVSKCSFAWRVAGSALSRLYSIKQHQRALTWNPSVMREVFGP